MMCKNIDIKLDMRVDDRLLLRHHILGWLGVDYHEKRGSPAVPLKPAVPRTAVPPAAVPHMIHCVVFVRECENSIQFETYWRSKQRATKESSREPLFFPPVGTRA